MQTAALPSLTLHKAVSRMAAGRRMEMKRGGCLMTDRASKTDLDGSRKGGMAAGNGAAEALPVGLPDTDEMCRRGGRRTEKRNFLLPSGSLGTAAGKFLSAPVRCQPFLDRRMI